MLKSVIIVWTAIIVSSCATGDHPATLKIKDGVMPSTFAYRTPFPADATIAFQGMGSYSFYGQAWYCINLENCFLVAESVFRHSMEALRPEDQRAEELEQYNEAIY